jgi:succinate dehydrogenase/fumarate reductase cytochrome b subunit
VNAAIIHSMKSTASYSVALALAGWAIALHEGNTIRHLPTVYATHSEAVRDARTFADLTASLNGATFLVAR